MALVEVTVVPLGTASTSLSAYVVECEKELRRCGEGLKWQLTAMGTIIEGELDQIWPILRRLHETPFNSGAMRVSTAIRIDDRRDVQGSIVQKVSSVESKL